STERFCFSKGLITTYWDSRYLGKLNLTNDTHLIVWSLFPRRSTDPPVQRSSSSDWIQMDLQRNSFSGESNSLRLYLDESRILKDCLFNPDGIGEPVPPKTDTFLSTLSNISVHDFNLHSGDSMLSICRMFQDKKTTLVRSLRRVERQTGISVGQTNALPNHLKMPNTNYCGPIYRLDRKRSLGIDSFIQQHMNASDMIPRWRMVTGILSVLLFYPTPVPAPVPGAGKRLADKEHNSFIVKKRVREHDFCGCLKLVGTTASNVVGILFFSIYQPYCFDFADWTVMQAVKRSSYSFVTPPTCHEPEPTVMK
ncbi:hypothetical protein T265_13781, partial [Opisthorchis viverrini]